MHSRKRSDTRTTLYKRPCGLLSNNFAQNFTTTADTGIGLKAVVSKRTERTLCDDRIFTIEQQCLTVKATSRHVTLTISIHCNRTALARPCRIDGERSSLDFKMYSVSTGGGGPDQNLCARVLFRRYVPAVCRTTSSFRGRSRVVARFASIIHSAC